MNEIIIFFFKFSNASVAKGASSQSRFIILFRFGFVVVDPDVAGKLFNVFTDVVEPTGDAAVFDGVCEIFEIIGETAFESLGSSGGLGEKSTRGRGVRFDGWWWFG